MPSNAMPYVVTTKRRCEPAAGTDDWPMLLPVSRQTVATLEEARRIAGRACLGSTPLNLENIEQARTLPEPGGTVGPLPDGTVIEVERVAD
jgi:hypothetical protein